MSIFYDRDRMYPNEVGLPELESLGPYAGFDVLPVTHNMREAIAEAFERRGELIAGATGIREFDDQAGQPMPWRSFLWTAPDRTSANAVRTFLDARKGRLVPFWAPTCCWDLTLKADVISPSATVLQLRRSGYVDFYWPLLSRRYVAIWAPGGAVLAKITDATEIDATTEQITIDTAAGVALPQGTPISYLVLCRLAEDLTRIRWFSTWGCEATIRFVELPLEVPA